MAEETPRDADAETTYIALTKRLEEQYIENLAFIEARGGIGENGWGVRDAFLDAADAVARLSPDQLAARVAVARARAAAPAPAPAAAPPAFDVPPVSGRFRGLGTAWGPRAPAPVGGQRPFAPRPVAPRAAPAPFVPQISCSQPGVTVSVSLWLPDVAHVDVVVQSLIRGDEAMVALRLTSGAVRRFGLRLSGAPARAYGQANPGPSTLVTITFVKQRREIAWPEPLAVVIPHDGASHPRTADEMLAEAMAPAPAPAPAAPAPPGRGKDIAALRRSISAADDVEVLPPPAPAPAPPRTPGAPAPAPTLVVTPAAPAPAPADEKVSIMVVAQTSVTRERFRDLAGGGASWFAPVDDGAAVATGAAAAASACTSFIAGKGQLPLAPGPAIAPVVPTHPPYANGAGATLNAARAPPRPAPDAGPAPRKHSFDIGLPMSPGLDRSGSHGNLHHLQPGQSPGGDLAASSYYAPAA